jgi:DNA-binding XRE family transcriptional regulator
VKNRLKEIRMKEYMMNQIEFAKILQISNTTYSNIENNNVQGNISTILKIAKLLNKPVETIWFLEDE